jgi:hypothetical protein
MGRKRNARATAVCLAIAVGVSACSTPTPKATPSEAATASEDELLSEAIDAYARYSAAFDAYLAQPAETADFSSLAETVTSDFAEVLEGEFAGDPRLWVQEGSSAFDTIELLNHSIDSTTVVSMTLCVDTSHIVLKDAEGHPVETDRAVRFPMQVELEGAAVDELLVADAFTAEGSETC